MKRYIYVASAILLAANTAYAQAVVTPNPGGAALVSNGHGYSRITQPTRVAIGDKIVVTNGNRAKIVYPDKCVAGVLPGAVLIVQLASPCAASSQAVGTGFVADTECPPGSTDDRCCPRNSDGTRDTFCGIAPYAIGGGLAAGGGIIALGVLSSNDRQVNPPPVTP